MESYVKYVVEFFESEMAVVDCKTKMEVLAVDLEANNVRIEVNAATITCNSDAMVAFVDDMPGKVRALLRKIDQVEQQGLKGRYESDFEGLRFCFRSLADADEAIRKFSRVARDMMPVMQIGRVIYAQAKLTPLRSSTSLKFYLPSRAIDGRPTEQWLEERRQAAQAINIETAEIASSIRSTFDPYEVYRKVPSRHRYDRHQEYFFRAPDSDIWVWFGDLPEATQNAYLTSRRSSDSQRYSPDEAEERFFDV
jgi:hypothetical protein